MPTIAVFIIRQIFPCRIHTHVLQLTIVFEANRIFLRAEANRENRKYSKRNGTQSERKANELRDASPGVPFGSMSFVLNALSAYEEEDTEEWKGQAG